MYKIYYTDPLTDTCYSCNESELTEALSLVKEKRNEGMVFVTMVCENPDSIGKPGVDSVVNGVLPSGEVYAWKMRR